VVNGAIHRVIEQQAAMQPDVLALVDGSEGLTYRELNQRANALARCLGNSGCVRGGTAIVRMPRSVDLAVVLLAVLKAGAAYAWVEPGSPDDFEWPASVCLLEGKPGRNGPESPIGSEQCYRAVDIRTALATCRARPSPNLPILTRGSDVACVLMNNCGEPQVLVAHETITSMPTPPRNGNWICHPGAFDLWVALMSGETLRLEREAGIPSAPQAA
jgi:hypothetical protein